MRRAYVLLSGGIDSTTCLHLAAREFDEVVGVSVDYGQRHRKEMQYAEASCMMLDVRHHVLDIAAAMPRTMLTDSDSTIPSISYAEIEGVSPTYVPFRNGFMLSAVTAFIVGERDRMPFDQTPFVEEQEWGLYFGAHAEDAHNWAYPDCTPEFIGAMANAIYIGTYSGVRLHTPLQWLNKAQIIQLGKTVGVDWRLTWSCYAGGELHCGVCPTCRARRAGFEAAGLRDPTVYERVAA